MKNGDIQISGDGRVEFDASGVPVAFQVFHAGKNDLTKDGKTYALELTADDLRTIENNFKSRGNLIPVDAKHILGAIGDALSADEDQLAKDNPALFSELSNGLLGVELRNNSLWLTVNKWADAVRGIFASKRSLIPFFSPVIRGVRLDAGRGVLDIPDRSKLRITSLTLCGADQPPALHNVPSLAATDRARTDDFAFAVLKLSEPAIQKQKHGDRMKKNLERLGALLGLSGDSLKLSDTEITGTAETLVQKAADEIETTRSRVAAFVGGVKDSLKLTGEQTLDTILAAVKSLAATSGGNALALTELRSQVDELAAFRKGAVIGELMKEGKLTAAMKPWAEGISLTDLNKWAITAPVVVQPGQTVAGNGNPPETKDGLMMTELDFEFAKNVPGKTMKDKVENFAKANRLKIPAAMLQRVALFFAFLVGVSAFFGGAQSARAADATGPINTLVRDGMYLSPLASSNILYAGTIAALNTNGYAVSASDTSGQKVIGIFDQSVDNTGSSYKSNKTVRVRRGVFSLATGSTNTVADIGNMAYVLDNQTVGNASEATNDIMAGIIVDVQNDLLRIGATDSTVRVWVDTLSVGRQGAATFTAFTASGNSSIAGSLNVTGAVSLASTLGVTGVTTLSGTNTVFGSSMVGGSITQQTVSAYIKVQGPGGTNYYLKAFLPTGP